ncbi:MAG: hypothetical protein KF819_37175 [Labilithrix sp.]|nr:hypothetical protein [Labilithrix sp.]
MIGLGIAAIIFVAAGARAEPTKEDKALALSLFRQARELMEAGSFAEACVKFDESQRLDPGGGTLLNLAVCHEAEGKTATAWAEYSDALALARRDGRADRIDLAREKMNALEPKISRLVVVVPPSATRVRRDGSDVPRVAWGSPIPVDPGEHVVEVTLAGGAITIERVTVEAAGDEKTLTITAPEAPPTAESPPPTPEVRESPRTGRTIVAWSLVGLGAAGVGLGAYFGLRAIAKKNESDEGCPGGSCTAGAVAANEDAKRAADVATISFAIGVVSGAIGATLLLTAPRTRTRSALRVSPLAGPGVGGLAVGGAF